MGLLTIQGIGNIVMLSEGRVDADDVFSLKDGEHFTTEFMIYTS